MTRMYMYMYMLHATLDMGVTGLMPSLGEEEGEGWEICMKSNCETNYGMTLYLVMMLIGTSH